MKSIIKTSYVKGLNVGFIPTFKNKYGIMPDKEGSDSLNHIKLKGQLQISILLNNTILLDLYQI